MGARRRQMTRRRQMIQRMQMSRTRLLPPQRQLRRQAVSWHCPYRRLFWQWSSMQRDCGGSVLDILFVSRHGTQTWCHVDLQPDIQVGGHPCTCGLMVGVKKK